MLATIVSTLIGVAAWVPTPTLPAMRTRLPSPTSSFANLLELEGSSPQQLEAKLSSLSSSQVEPSSSSGLLGRARSSVMLVLLFVRMLFWRCMGKLDNLYILTRLFRGAKRPLFFANGWGDLDVIRKMFASTCEDLKRGTVMNQLAEAGSTIHWEAADADDVAESLAGSIKVRKGSFRSPCHRVMPAESHDCHIEMCYPKATTVGLPWEDQPPSTAGTLPPPKEIVLLLPATGEETPDERRQLAHTLAEKGGVCSILLTAPYYGTRRPAGQSEHYVRTVADYLIQSAAVTFEAAHVMRFCALQWPGVRLCLSGFSWGGAMSGVVGIVGSQCLPAKKKKSDDGTSTSIVAVPYAGSPTAAVIADGVLAADIDWDALAADPSRGGGGGGSESEGGVRGALLEELLAMHLSSFTDALKEGGGRHLNALDGLHAVCFRDDSFVKVEYADQLYGLLADCCRSGEDEDADAQPHVQQQWLGGGHARAYFSKGSLLPQIIMQALRGGAGA